MRPHKWVEDVMSIYLKRDHWQFYHCSRCGGYSDAVRRGTSPSLAPFTNQDCDEFVVRSVLES